MKFLRLKIFFLIAVLSFSVSCSRTHQHQTEKPAEQTDPVLAELDHLNQAIQKDSINPGLFEKRAKFYLKNNEYNEALKDITTTLEIDSTNSEYYVTLSDVYLALGKLRKTIESLEKAIDLDNDNTEAILKLAEMSIVIRDYKKALSYIDKALHINDMEPKGYFLRGLVMLENGDTLRGIKNFQKAIDVDQQYFDAYVQLGSLYADKHNNLAIDYFNNALNLQPGNNDVIYSLAMYYQETGQYDKAIQHYQTLLSNDPDNFIALYNIGYINLVYLQQYQTAIEYFTKSIEKKNDYVEAYYNRGFAYEMLKDAQHSKSDYQKALDLKPNYDKAISGLNRVETYLSRENQ